MDAKSAKSLGDLAVGRRCRVLRICPESTDTADGFELEQRLLELGFAEGEELEILHEGPLYSDPIAVRVGEQLLALRRAEAKAILIEES